MKYDTRIDFKKFSQVLCDMHNERGFAAICMDRDHTDAFFLVHTGKVILENLVKDDETVSLPERRVSPKKVRKLLWEHRKDPRLQDYTSVVWSMYDRETNRSVIGWARVKPVPQPEVADAKS